MKTLSEENRKKLKNTVIKAREIAEEAAEEVTESLGVREKNKLSHLGKEESKLRVDLRAKARQLGDELHDNGYQETERLEREIAYEHWHRMLFAEFLAENDLLIHPEMEVSVTIEECNQLAEEREEMDGFELAAQFASDMLPEIFKKYDPVLDIKLAPEYRKELKDLIANLPKEVFKAEDSLGWVYQFWQEKKKDEINESEVDIGANELPAVTQLFTEHYMVNFLLDNTLGAWWKSRHPNEELPIDFEYLRITDDGKPAAGEFEGWPDKAADIEVLDPAMGSGHFLITALPMLAYMRIKEENLPPEKAVNAVLKDNLFGLEIDERCTQIAAFALAFSAWKFPETGGYRELPELNIACSGIAPEGDKEEWLELAEENEKLERGLSELYDQFQEAPTLGSLVNPNRKNGELLKASFNDLQPILGEALNQEITEYKKTSKMVSAKGLAEAAYFLSKKFDLVVTNVPYLGKSRQAEILKQFTNKYYGKSKSDLATVFTERCLELSKEKGFIAVVTTQFWYFLTSYEKFRHYILNNFNLSLSAKLGSNAFTTIGGEVVNVALSVIQRDFKQDHSVSGVNAIFKNGIDQKADEIKYGELKNIPQRKVRKNPDSRIFFQDFSEITKIDDIATVHEGLHTGDYKRFGRFFWEFDEFKNGWEFQLAGPNKSGKCEGRQNVLKWEGGNGELIQFLEERLNGSLSMWIKGEEAWNNEGITVSSMSNLKTTKYDGEIFTHGIFVIIPDEKRDKATLWNYCNSEEFYKQVRLLDQKISIARGTLEQTPIDLKKWREKGAQFGYPSTKSTNPNQWIFSGKIEETDRPLQVALARLVGYKWPEQPARAPSQFADEDGIVCLPAVKGERKAVDRIRDILADAYGKEWSHDKETELLKKVDYGKYNLERWLWFKFAKQHYKLFNNRPFIWHVTDGKKGGFSALVNYHQLDKKNLESLTYSYLGDWITKQERRYQKDKEGAEGLLQAAEELKEKLEAIIEGKPPYNIFVRWKTIAEQPIHWNPDLDDGVRMNIRPFYRAGILRHSSSLSINWNKDRGKDPESSYWYQKFKKSGLSEDKYSGERYNRYEDFPFTEGKLTNKKIRNARLDNEERDYEEYLE